MEQMLELVVLGIANCLVEAAASAGRSDDVPQAYTPFGQPLEPPIIIQRLQLFADRCAEQPPELVGRVSIITPRRERCVAR